MSETLRRNKMYEHAIRALLLANEDGMAAGDLAKAIGANRNTVQSLLNNTYGFYVDRWTQTGSTYAGIWCVIKVPENCPRPDGVPA